MCAKGGGESPPPRPDTHSTPHYSTLKIIPLQWRLNSHSVFVSLIPYWLFWSCGLPALLLSTVTAVCVCVCVCVMRRERQNKRGKGQSVFKLPLQYEPHPKRKKINPCLTACEQRAQIYLQSHKSSRCLAHQAAILSSWPPSGLWCCQNFGENLNKILPRIWLRTRSKLRELEKQEWTRECPICVRVCVCVSPLSSSVPSVSPLKLAYC